ncbi:YqaA family protein [uncultured Bacteroides sp.]|uniref:YqaA family protein n=1 Tax=uncultured Bacteroides sp. TaxID=162156 RepID=UPI002617D72D|nr:YqaA family protein [uncultured Bacteroides sp.]
MDAFIDTLIQLLIDWGYLGLFISALLAGSIIPFSSELVMIALVKVGLNPALCVLAATLGNTIGGMTCYYMGHLGKVDWIENYFKVKKEKIEKMQHFLQGKGALMAFFAFLPFVGEVIAIALGFMRSNILLTTLSMFVGKLIRYIVMLLALQGAISMIHYECTL